MEARTFQDADTPHTVGRNGEAVRSRGLDPKVSFALIRSRTGKAVLTVPKDATPLVPCSIYDLETDWICATHSDADLLVLYYQFNSSTTDLGAETPWSPKQ